MTPYFPHESNARNDEKIIALRMKHGWQGYGIYWAIIEKLRDAPGHRLSTEYRIIAYDLQTDIRLIESIIRDFGLFEAGEDSFHSPALSLQMEWKETRISQARQAASLRWKRTKASLERKQESTLFVPPTLKEVALYCKRRCNSINPVQFIDFYQSKGWMIGASPMKDWKAAIRRWENKNKNKANYPQNADNEHSRIHPALQ